MNIITRILTMTGLFAGSLQMAQGQANDLVFPPNKRIHYSTTMGWAGDFPGTSAIPGCGAGPGYLWSQPAGAVTDESGNGMVFVQNCGTYNPSTGAKIGDVSSPYTFAVPGLCNQYYSLSWETVFGPPHYYQLVLRQVDASNPSAITVTSSSVIATGNAGLTIAPAPLAADGSRKVYFSDEGGIRYITISSGGSVSAVTTMQTFTSPVQVRQEPAMEVSPDGRKLLVCFLSNVRLLDLTTNTFTTVGPFTSSTIVSGIEYVPYSGPGGDRVYFSYHSPSMFPSSFEGLGYVSLSAPTVLIDALGTLPAGMSKSGFGFSEIERAKNGYLHFAYHTNYASHWVLNGDVGQLYWTYPPVAGSFGVVANNTTTAAVSDGVCYIVQKQIDGEDYRSFTLAAPSFTVNGVSQSGSAIPTLLLCDNDRVKLYTSTSGYYSGYTVTIQKGNVSGSSFTPTGSPITSTLQPGSRVKDTIDLQSLFGVNLDASYSGGLRVTYIVYSGCGSQSATQTVNLSRAYTLARHYAPKYISAFSRGTKELQKTLPITTPMPSASTPNNFRIAIGNAIGWMGASSCGADSITTNGSYNLRVYEVEQKIDTVISGGSTRIDTTIQRRVYVDAVSVPGTVLRDTAPDICYYFDNVAVTDFDIPFNTTTLRFDTSSNKNFYYDKTLTNQDWFNWFSDYYTWAYNAGKLAEFSSKTYCVEFTVATTQGCTVVNRSYFRIANNGLANGAAARPGATDMEEAALRPGPELFPNPVSDNLTIRLSAAVQKAELILSDIAGRTIRRQEGLQQGDNSVSMKDLAPGTYLYKIIADERIYTGKVTRK